MYILGCEANAIFFRIVFFYEIINYMIDCHKQNKKTKGGGSYGAVN